MTTKECLSRGQLKEYLSGWVDVAATERIEAHLADCSDCEQTIVSLEADPETLLEFASSAINPPDAAASEDVESRPSQNTNSPVAQALRAAKLYTPAREQKPAGSHSAWPHVGQEVAGYELLRPLGRGGMGTVYVAKHNKLGKEVAIKLLPNEAFRDPSFADRFQREIRAAGGLEHTSIVRATDAGEAAGVHYLVMELVDGLDLSRIVRLADRLGIADACEIGRQIALGLSYAHATGIVHRDVKPSNIVLARDGTAKLLDFGLARATLWDEVSVELTTVGQLMGTIDYMAPEQAERPESVDYRADLYALGATLFRLLAGRTPLSIAPSLSPLAKLRLLAMHEPPLIHTLRDDVPSELVKLISELLARNPDARPPSADHVAERLAGLGQESDLPRLVQLAIEKAGDETDFEAAPEREPQIDHALKTATRGSDATGQNDSGRRSSIGAWLLTGLTTFGLLAAGLIFTLETLKGQLVVESDVPGVTVQITQNGKVSRELKIENGTESTRLWAGQYEVVLSAGSDSVEVIGGRVSVMRGETKIARVQLAAQEDSTAAPLPATSAELQPGDRLRSAWLSNTELNHRATITADRTIKLPMIGTVSVAGLNLQQLETEIRRRYARYTNDPDVEVFRDVSPEVNANELTSAMRGAAVPPASTAELQPGDALLVSALNAEEVACRVLVQADYTIKPILLGTVSVKGKTVDQLEEELGFRYSKYVKDPAIQLFRDFTSPGPTWATPGGSATKQTLASKPSLDSNEPMYDSRTLSQWLELLRRERSSEALHDVFEALDALVSKSTSERITTEILQVVPDRSASTRVRNNSSNSTLDGRAFPLLQKANPGKAYFDLLRDQLASTEDPSWAKRIVSRGLLFRHAKAEDIAELNNWLLQNILLSDDDNELRRWLLLAYRQNAIDSPQHKEVAKLLVESVTKATGDDNTFWFDRNPRGSSRRKSGTPISLEEVEVSLHPLWCKEVSKRAVLVLQSAESPQSQVIQAERILYALCCANRDEELGINRKLLGELVIGRVRALSDDHLLSTQELPADFRRSYGVLSSGYGFGAFNIKVDEDRYESADVEALALIDLALATLTPDDNQQFLNDLLERIEHTVFDFNFAAFPALPTLNVRKAVDALKFPDFEDPRNEMPYATPQRWLALIVACRICDGLERESRAAFAVREADAQRQRWLASLLRTEAGTQERSAITFQRARVLLNASSQPGFDSAKWEEICRQSDTNHDSTLDADELTRLYVQLRPPPYTGSAANLEWARRMIGKYDSNEDKALTADEWNRMIIKPTKADYNKDGIITIEEYARYRGK